VGIDRERVLARARERGLFGTGVVPSDRELHEIVFEPGFSTADRVTELSGRGVGMDVVRRNVASLRGTVDLSSREGLGTVLTIRVPLTLTVMPGLLVDVGGERYVVPIENVRECLDLAAGEDAGQGAGVADVRGELLPYLRARRLLDAPDHAASRETLIVIEHEQEKIGLAVDDLLGEAQVVVKPLGRPLQGVPGISGSTILGDGRVALILDPAALASQARGEGRA
jgi:two-component system chemotaxis sensor kinase CheA